MRAPKVVDFYTAAWPDFTPALTSASLPKREQRSLLRNVKSVQI